MSNETVSEETNTAKKPTKTYTQASDPASESVKLKIALSLDPDHPLAKCQQQLKDRGVKNPDLAGLITEGLETLDAKWWDEKLEEIVPLDIKVQEALKNPELREKLSSFFTEIGDAGEAAH